MLIRHVKRERTEFDVHEWNGTVQAYVKAIDSFEALVFNDFARDFFDRSLSCEERFKAAFSAAKMVLVDAQNKPLLTDDDYEAIRYADFAPIFRVFTVVLNETAPTDDDAPVESAKKN